MHLTINTHPAEDAHYDAYARHQRGPQPFHLAPVLAAALAQWHDRPQFIAPLMRCTQQWPESRLYTWLCDAHADAATLGPTRHAGGGQLWCAAYGALVVDFHAPLTDPTQVFATGIEFLDLVLARDRYAPQMKVVHVKM